MSVGALWKGAVKDVEQLRKEVDPTQMREKSLIIQEKQTDLEVIDMQVRQGS